jgi:serine protease Do
MQVLTGGPVSPRASDFPAVYQHDTIVAPNQCGGPIVDLDGHALGINIARAGRTETYALPADLILPLIEPLKSGKLAPVNANEPNGVKTGEKAATQPSKGE